MDDAILMAEVIAAEDACISIVLLYSVNTTIQQLKYYLHLYLYLFVMAKVMAAGEGGPPDLR